MSVLTVIRIKRVNFRENVWAFPRRDKRNCPQFIRVSACRVSVKRGLGDGVGIGISFIIIIFLFFLFYFLTQTPISHDLPSTVHHCYIFAYKRKWNAVKLLVRDITANDPGTFQSRQSNIEVQRTNFLSCSASISVLQKVTRQNVDAWNKGFCLKHFNATATTAIPEARVALEQSLSTLCTRIKVFQKTNKTPRFMSRINFSSCCFLQYRNRHWTRKKISAASIFDCLDWNMTRIVCVDVLMMHLFHFLYMRS